MWIVPPGEDTASYWLRLGIALVNGGQYEEASKAFDRSMSLIQRIQKPGTTVGSFFPS